MTGKELLLRALGNDETPRPAWLPFVGAHGGRLIEKNATDYLRSSDHIVAGLTRAHERYRPDGLPIVFDLQMEAEVLGCDLQWADEVPPSVTSHPLADRNIADLPRFSTDRGRYPLVADALARLKPDIGADTALYGLLTGPFTLAAHLRGSELFLDLMMEPERVKALMAYCADIALTCADFYADRGVDAVAVVDPMTSQISTAHFDEFVAPDLDRVFDHVAGRGLPSSLFVCGDATRNLEAMCRGKCDNLQVDENIPLELLKNLSRKYHKSFGGNLRLTTVLLLGTEADCMLDAIRCMDVGGSAGFILAPGCDLPYATPEANLEAVARMVHDDYQRQIARTTVKASSMGTFEDLALPDYANDPQVYIDVITLDSAACAPCLYMTDAAHRAARRAQAPVVVREHKVKTREGVGYMCRLRVENIPTICIDGRVAFASVIPDGDTLVAAIEKAAREKGLA